MHTLKILKWVCGGILLISVGLTAFCLSQPVDFYKSNYSSYSSSSGSSSGSSMKPTSGSSSSSSTKPTNGSSSSSSTKPTNGSSSSSSTKPTNGSSTKPSTSTTTSNSGDMKIYDFSFVKVGLPNEYTSQLTVEKKAETGKTYNVLLRVYEKTSKEESEKDLDESLGMLFEIGYVKISKYSGFQKLDYPASTVFAKDSANYYIYTEPTDYQFYRSDGGTSKEQANWQTLQKIGAQVKTHFLKENNVDSYTVKPDIDSPSVNITPTVPVSKDCTHCNGSGACSHCLFGDCPSCYGKGRFNCNTCIGLGRCGSCGGSGYTYKGVGESFRKVDCSRCRGSGDCRSCNGFGYSSCYACSSTGNCSICSGLGTCRYCYGSGKQ